LFAVGDLPLVGPMLESPELLPQKIREHRRIRERSVQKLDLELFDLSAGFYDLGLDFLERVEDNRVAVFVFFVGREEGVEVVGGRFLEVVEVEGSALLI
jgi:hypothetical protein